MCELCKLVKGVTTALVKGEFLWVCDKCFRKNGCK